MVEDLSKISLVTYNTYLIPDFWVTEFCITCKNQRFRAAELGKIVNQYDVGLLQEVWGAQTNRLDAGLDKTHTILSKYRSGGGTFVDFFRNAVTKPGGLYGTFRKEFRELWFDCYRFKKSIPKICYKGVFGCLLDISSRKPGHTLLVFNTHTDHVNENRGQEIQLDEIKEFIGSSLTQIHRKFPKFDFSKCTVVVAGDFNIDITNPRMYKMLKDKLGGRDLYFEYCCSQGKRPEETLDVANTYNRFTQARVDYVWGIDAFDDIEFLPAKVIDGAVIKQESELELSDHWGLTVTLDL